MTPPAMSRWQCVQQVWAEKIVNIRFNPNPDNGRHITWVMANGEIVEPSTDLLNKGGTMPVGGYYVLYHNGCENWAPADLFEAGYARIKGD